MINLTNTINNAGMHTECKKQSIEYGISNGSYWYWCHNCKHSIQKNEIAPYPQKRTFWNDGNKWEQCTGDEWDNLAESRRGIFTTESGTILAKKI